MNVARVVVIMLAPSATVGAALGAVVYGLRAVRYLRRRLRRDHPQPDGPPIEQLAADLRRLIRQHHAVKSAPDLMMRAHHLYAIEGAITGCAVQAASALDVPHPPVPRHSALT